VLNHYRRGVALWVSLVCPELSLLATTSPTVMVGLSAGVATLPDLSHRGPRITYGKAT
jgi:hypothetical protein